MIKFLFSAFIILITCSTTGCKKNEKRKVFDVHLHGDPAPEKQLSNLSANDVYAVAVSTSWTEQQQYKTSDKLTVLHGLFVPCPNGKVPYSKQLCFADGKEWPEISWVEQQIKERKIDFIGEVLTQYHGVSMSDTMMDPYYALAEKYNLPVGIHTGSAGPNHGCPNFKEEMGNPLLLKNTLAKFPKLRVWLMHAGGPFVKECLTMMKEHPGLYTDISVLNNPNIIPPEAFAAVMKEFIDARLEDRLLFGSDNADIKTTITSVQTLDFLSAQQKEKIFHLNATAFFTVK
ncbi:amidohydrolase [Lacibacter luteus]|uniref:Amidohydrolase n=1 Tax=Lacibacter luteus TaxID=2508719 RepID=A0A4Q1CPU9_9BACT|nr:amidohydrolase family protein [Lacibacter luteus]RXK62835.1 amidohydrolase [Lacibacter luteus]